MVGTYRERFGCHGVAPCCDDTGSNQRLSDHRLLRPRRYKGPDDSHLSHALGFNVRNLGVGAYDLVDRAYSTERTSCSARGSWPAGPPVLHQHPPGVRCNTQRTASGTPFLQLELCDPCQVGGSCRAARESRHLTWPGWRIRYTGQHRRNPAVSPITNLNVQNLTNRPNDGGPLAGAWKANSAADDNLWPSDSRGEACAESLLV